MIRLNGRRMRQKLDEVLKENGESGEKRREEEKKVVYKNGKLS